MRRTPSWVLGGLLAAALAWPVTASAESRPTMLADHPIGKKHSAAELELGWYTDSEGGATLHIFTPFIGYRYAPTENVEFELDWPFVLQSLSPAIGDGSVDFFSGNPFLAAYYVGAIPDGYFRLGGGLAPPLASVDLADSNATEKLTALSGASAMRGFWDMWLYMFDRFSLVLPAQIEANIDGLVVGGDFAFAHMIGTDDVVAANDETIVQLAGLIGGRIDKTTLGVRLQLMWLASSDAGQGDDAQLAFVPFVQADTSGFFYGKIVLNLDEPLGLIGSNGADVWGLFLGGGGRY